MSETQKHTKPNVPNLRFPGFEGEWKNTLLKNECVINPKTSKLEDQFLYIDLESVVKGQLVKQNVISKEGAPSRAQRVLSKWDILYQCVRPYQLNNYIVRDDYPLQRVASTGYAQIRTNHDPDFLFQLLHTKKFTDQVINRCTGTNYPAINSTDLGEIGISVPGIKEQERIAVLLTLIDHRIAIQSKVIERYESLIKAINQRHFKNVRENDSLSLVKLSMILRERKEYCENDGTYPHASLSKDGIDKKTERYDRDFLVRDEEKKYKVTRLNDICYNPANLKFGVISRNKIGTLIFSPIYVTFEIASNYNTEYMEYYLTNPDFVRYMLKYEQGTVYERMSVSPEDFLTESIRVPSLSKQHKHSAIISSLNRRLDVERMTLINWCHFKQGCLKQLFI